jgi:N4-gp56 family major capsid protein
MTTLEVLQKNGLSVNEYFSKRLLEMIKLERSNFVFTNLGVEMNLPKNEGTKTFTVRRYNHLPLNAVSDHLLTEGVAPEALKPEGHKVSGTINQYGVIMDETDVAADIHFDNIKAIYQPELARHAAELIERNIVESFTDASEYYVGTAADAADDITASAIVKFKDFRVVALTMSNANRRGHSKYGGKFVAVMHPNVMNDLLDDEVLVNKLLVPGSENGPIKQGTLAKYMAYGMYFTDTLICPVTKNGSGVNVYKSYVLGYNPYMVLGLGSSNVKFYDTGFTADKSDPLGQKATFGYKLWTGAKVIDPMAITTVYSASGYDIALNDGTYLNEGAQKVDVPGVTAGTNSIPEKWEL